MVLRTEGGIIPLKFNDITALSGGGERQKTHCAAALQSFTTLQKGSRYSFSGFGFRATHGGGVAWIMSGFNVHS